MNFVGKINDPIDNVQTLAFMVWCAKLHTNRASMFGGPEA